LNKLVYVVIAMTTTFVYGNIHAVHSESDRACTEVNVPTAYATLRGGGFLLH
jgi:hypothetical protein